MPTKAKKNKNAKKNAKKTAKPQNKKVAINAKKNGKTVTFQAKPKTDPFGKRSLPAFKSDGSPVGKVNVETGVRPAPVAAAPAPQVPNRPHPMMVCACGDPNCRNSRPQPQQPQPQQRNPNEIPPFIRQLAEDLGTQMGAQHVMVVGIPLNPANPRTEPPSQAEFEGLLRAILGGN